MLFMVLVITVALIFQFFKSEAEESTKLAEITQEVLHIKLQDIKINEDSLKAATFKTPHFSHILKMVTGLTSSLEKTTQDIITLNEESIPPLNVQMERLNSSVEKRIIQVKRLKSQITLTRESDRFLNSIVHDHTLAPFSNISALILNALDGIKTYQIFQTPDQYEAAQAVLTQIKRENENADENLKTIISHMEIELKATQDISQIMEQLFIQDSQDHVNLLLHTLQNIHKNQQEKFNGFLYILLSVAAGILCALAYSLTRWNQARAKSLRSKRLFKDAAESISEGFAFFGPDDRLVFSNSTFKNIYKSLEGQIEKGTLLRTFQAALDEKKLVVQSDLQHDGSSLDQHKDGRWILSSSNKMEHGGHALVRVDLTDQKNAQEQLEVAATVFQSAGEAMMVTDAQNHIQMVNPAFTAITGYEENEVLGQKPEILNSGRHATTFFEAMFQTLIQTGVWQGEIWNRRKNGEIFPEWLSITTLYNDDETVKQRVSLFTDITSRKKSEERIHYQANYDSLTGLPNRNLFHDRLKQSINQARRSKKRIALLFLDIDHFKHINDTLGHIMGDELLRQIAQRLRIFFRSSDTIARLGGDEFTIIINDAAHNADLEQLLDRLLEKLSGAYDLDANTTYTSVSVGVTYFPDDGDSLETLLQNADAAMFKAKEMGRNTYCFFTPEMNTRAQERHALEIALHGALEKNHFVLHYQPIVDPVSQTVVSTEALVRWQDPERGLIPPGKFIPIAEDTGLIVEMGEWILLQACRDAAHWNITKGLNVGVSVNLSSRQFKRSNILQLVQNALAETKLPASKLTLEITESLLVDDDSDVLQTLRSIRDLGVLLSIDDFGTGYSSLSYLKKFPITTLKIDQSFINGVLINSEDAALTQAILSMAQSLNLKVIAEGVESSGQVAFLLERQCNLIQGYYYSRPVPVEDLLLAFEVKKLTA